MGGNAALMVRTAGVPAIMYGCETMGLSDSCLHEARCKVASAAAPNAGGKNHLLTLLAIDGQYGTLDPAFDAHVGPIKHWALAVWDKWFPITHMQMTHERARHKLAGVRSSWWASVCGPTTAMLATAKRLSWQCLSATALKTDVGRVLDLLLDPPVLSPPRSGNRCVGPDGIRSVKFCLASFLTRLTLAVLLLSLTTNLTLALLLPASSSKAFLDRRRRDP